MATPQPARELTTWKDIAGYLGVSTRTAQKWERERGLPVRRIPGERGRVFADPDELSRWKNAAPAAPNGNGAAAFVTVEVSSGAPAAPARSRLRIIFAAAGLLTALGAGSGWWLASRPGAPAGFRLEGDYLVVSDARGREVWRRAVPGVADPNTLDEFRHSWIGDLDGDGHTELLFQHYPRHQGRLPAAVSCYSDTGAEKWRFEPSEVPRTAEGAITNPPRIIGLEVGRVGKPARNAVVVAWGSAGWFSTQIALLTPAGQKERSYWHSGVVQLYGIADLDGDGRTEILAAGTNNGYNQATLLLLDPDTMAGVSREVSAKHQLLGAPGVEKARLIFPRTCLSRLLDERNWVSSVVVRPGELQVWTREYAIDTGALYVLGPHLEVRHAEVTDGYKVKHREQERLGKLDHALTAQEERALAEGVSYLSGGPATSGRASNTPPPR